MKKRLLTTTAVAMVIALAAFAVYSGAEHARAQANFLDAKAELVHSAHNWSEKAERLWARGWLDVSREYVKPVEYGELRQIYKEAATGDRYEQWSFGAVGGEALQRVRRGVQRQLAEAGKYPITNRKIRERLDRDPRIEYLNDLWDARGAVYRCGRQATEVTRRGELKALREQYEEREQRLLKLLSECSLKNSRMF